MLRLGQLSWQSLMQMSREHPPRFVEFLMLVLAIALLSILAIAWQNWQQWPYAVLSLSYSIGASLSFLVRETWIESSSPRLTPATALTFVFLAILVLGLGYIVRGAIAFQQ